MDLKNLDTKNNNIVVGGKYQLKERLGGGSFGQIYSASNRESDVVLAVKLEKRAPNMYLSLSREARVISDLAGEQGFPTIYQYGKEENFNYMVMNMLGFNLEKLFKLCTYRFSLKTVLMLADQMLTRIEVLHSKNYLHRDIKPENFCMGASLSNRILFLIDFGLARSFRDSDGKHIAYRENKGLVGTARYASINTHLGIEQSRRDDLESIGYAMIYLMKGKLPWQSIKATNKQEKYQLIAQAKMRISTEALCKDLPDEFITYMNYVRNLGFTDAPNYKYLKKLFRTLFIESGFDFDYNYDWLQALRSSSINEIGPSQRQKPFKDNIERLNKNTLANINEENKQELNGKDSKDAGKIYLSNEERPSAQSKRKAYLKLKTQGENDISKKKAQFVDLPMEKDQEASISGDSSKINHFTQHANKLEEDDIPIEINAEIISPARMIEEKKEYNEKPNEDSRYLERKPGRPKEKTLMRLKSAATPETKARTTVNIEKSRFKTTKKRSMSHEENLEESLICEWQEGNILEQMINQKKFIV